MNKTGEAVTRYLVMLGYINEIGQKEILDYKGSDKPFQ